MMGSRQLLPVLAALSVVWPPALGAGHEGTAPAVIFRGATIWTMGTAGVLHDADLLVVNGKVAGVGQGLEAPSGATVIDAAGKHITPGLLDAHSHAAVDGPVNEGSHNVTAEVRIADVLDPDDIAIYRQLAGGLTTANLLHGSANSIGGQNAVIKLRWGSPAAGLLIPQAPPGIKFALGENPKRSNFRVPGGPPRYPATRMGVAASIREALLQARDYAREWEEYEALEEEGKSRREPPRRDHQMDALVEVLDGERMVHSHCYRQDEILMLIRLAEEFGITISTFQHVLEGYKVADEIAAHGAGASTFSDWWAYKAEAFDAIPHNGALMARRGVLVSFNSDSSELARRMNLEAAKAVKYGGLSEEEALALVTINPARQLGIDRWVGSLEEGKDADVALWSGHPLSTYSICEQTWVDGRRLFHRREDLAARDSLAEERADLLERVRSYGEDEKEEESGKEPEESSGDGDEDAEKKGLPAALPSRWSAPQGLPGGVVALKGGTVHTVSGPVIPGGTVLIGEGRIQAVGRDVDIPPGSRVLDLDGLHVYPGMIDADTVLGLTEIGSVAGTNDISETGLINPEVRVELAVNPDSELIPVTRANGITHVLAAPRGRVVSGTSALIRLDGWTWEDMTASAPLAMHVQWPEYRSGFDFVRGRRTTEEELEEARQEESEAMAGLLSDARAYRLALEAAVEDGRFQRDPSLEAMQPVLDGTIPVVVHADDLRQIREALRWAEKEGLRIILAGGYDSWRISDELKRLEVPVILGPVHRNPIRRHEPYDTPYTVALKLHQAGVAFCIGGGGSRFTASSTRNLPYGAAMAASFGLPKEEALKAVTLYPARILGLAGHLGSIDPGKSASLMVTDGDPLEIRTRVKHVFIDGREADLMNRHRRLYERYASRPRAAGEP